MIKNLIIFDILASLIKHTLINWQKDDQHQDETTLRGVLGYMDHEDIIMQHYHSKWEIDSSVRGETRGDQGEDRQRRTQVQVPGDGRVKSGDRRFGGAENL